MNDTTAPRAFPALPTHRPWTRVITCLIILAALTIAAGCGGALPDKGRVTAAAGEPFVLGVITERGGAIGGEGADIAAAATLAATRLGDVRGHPIEVTVVDGGCDAPAAAGAARRLAGDPRLVGVIGPVCSAACVSASLPLDEAGVVMVTPRCTDVAVTRQGFEGVDRTTYTDAYNAAAAARLANNILDVDHVFLIHDGTLYGRGLRDVFKLIYGKDKLAGTEEAAVGAVDFSAVVRAVRASGAGMIYYAGFPDDAARLVQQLRAGGVTLPIVLSDAALTAPDLAAQLDGLPGAVYTTRAEQAPGPGSAGFTAAFQQAYGRAPGPYAAEAYDAAMVILRAARDRVTAVGDTATIDHRALRTAVRDVAIDGASGRIRFRVNGDRRDGTSAILLRASGGRFVEERTIALDD